MQRILVLRGGALGDLLVTLPALAGLRQRWPKAFVELVGNATAASLAVDAGIIDYAESQHAEPWHQFYTDEISVGFRTRLASYDLVVNFWPDPCGDIARHFPLRTDQTYLPCSASPGTGPAAKHLIDCLAPLKLSAIAPLTPLREPNLHKDIVAVHPGSGSASKNWPMTRWHQLADWLQEEWHFQVRVVRGEAEPADALSGYGPVWHSLPLRDLADRLATCRLFLGHDSGISHLAASCGINGILLFGPTNPAIWAPPTTRFTIVKGRATLTDITLDEVKTAVHARLQEI